MMAGISNSQQSTEGLLQMMKKREKLNNSAMSTSKPISTPIIPPQPQQLPQQDTQQFMQQLSKLYQSKRTPTAGSNPPANANNGGGSRDNSQTNPSKKAAQVSSGQKDAKSGMKFTGFTQDNWNTGAADFQKLLQLENIKKGMARKSSKENNTSAGPIIVGSHGTSNKNNFINNLVFPQNAVESDGSEGNLISAGNATAAGGANAATRQRQQQIIQQ